MILGSPSSVSDLCSHIAFYRKFSFLPARARLIPRSFIAPRCSSSVQEIQKSSSPSEDRQLSSELYASAPFPPVKVAKRVVLVRHGQSTWNAEGRIQGSSNFSVFTKKGEAQAETSRQMLIDDKFDVCFASPLARSKRTAEIIWEAREPQIITEYDLREIDLYSFQLRSPFYSSFVSFPFLAYGLVSPVSLLYLIQGLLKHEGKEKFGPVYRQWQVDAANFIVDGHYPVRELWERARSCWDKILAHDSRSILVVAHNAVNQALVATAIGLGTEYFRTLLQSNCGVSVLDFIPRSEGGSPHICLNRLNQTPGSPVASGKSGGRKTSEQIILVCHGYTQGNAEDVFLLAGDQQLNVLGAIQSQKSAELLLDLKVNSIISSPNKACIGTASAISQVQEAADCLGADCVPRFVEMKQMENLDVETIFQQSEDISNFSAIHPGWLNKIGDGMRATLWNQSGKVWQSLLEELAGEASSVVVVIGHPAIHIALMGHCLNVTKEWLGSFHLDAGSVSVIDFPDGHTGRGVIRCINYTANLGRWSIPITRSTEDSEEF